MPGRVHFVKMPGRLHFVQMCAFSSLTLPVLAVCLVCWILSKASFGIYVEPYWKCGCSCLNYDFFFISSSCNTTSSGSLFSCEIASSKRISAVFQEIGSGKSMTAGLRKVTDDMKTKNQTARTGVIRASEKEACTSSFSFSKARPPNLELQMGCKLDKL